MYVEISDSWLALGKMVLKPSNAALPGLSVTPGLKPTEITKSGIVSKILLDWRNV